jgi:hypothetical protein
MGISHGAYIYGTGRAPQPGPFKLGKSGQEFHFPPPPGQSHQANFFQNRISPLNSYACYHKKSRLVKQSPKGLLSVSFCSLKTGEEDQ